MKNIKTVSIVFISLIVLTPLVLFFFRESILQSALHRIIASRQKAQGIEINISEAHFKGLSGLSLSGISVVPDDRDTLLRIDEFFVRIKVFPLLIGRIKLSELEMQNGKLALINKAGKQNFDFLFRKKEKDTTKSRGKLDIANFADNLINELLYKVPDEMSITNCVLEVIDEDKRWSIKAEEIHIENNRLSSTYKLNKTEATWHMTGYINSSEKILGLKLFADAKKVELPYLYDKFNLKFNFDTIQTTMRKIEWDDEQLKIYGSWSITNLLVNHPKLALGDVTIDAGSIDCNMFFGANFVSIDSSSTIYLNQVKAHPFMKYTVSPSKIYEMKMIAETIGATQFFASFPRGLLRSIEGLRADGSLSYSLDFYLDAKQPDSVRFNSTLAKQNFRIKKFGNANFQKINEPFTYTPYEYGIPVRTIFIGPENPYFTSYEQVSDYLKNCVLTAEDGSFFRHRGFNEEAFCKSIATNFKAGRFKRGGSTISMQLVKNVFLNRNKTISRKLEEALIVWLIESNYLVSKQRMFEVYLNIIEWGPNVYGIGEASRFYFSKAPAQLTFGESIFLSSIVPRPKYFKYSFTETGQLKPHLRGYFNLISGILLRRNAITPNDTVNLFSSVQLTGIAKNFIIPADTIPPLDEEVEAQEILEEVENNR